MSNCPHPWIGRARMNQNFRQFSVDKHPQNDVLISRNRDTATRKWANTLPNLTWNHPSPHLRNVQVARVLPQYLAFAFNAMNIKLEKKLYKCQKTHWRQKSAQMVVWEKLSNSEPSWFGYSRVWTVESVFFGTTARFRRHLLCREATSRMDGFFSRMRRVMRST